MKRLSISIMFSIMFLIALKMPGHAERKKTSSDADFSNPEAFSSLLKCNYDEAISIFTKGLILNPMDANSYFYRGIANHRKGQYEKAISDYNNAIEIDPNYTEAYFNRGIVYQHKGRYIRAVSDYTLSIKIDSRYAEAYKNRGLIYFLRKEYDKALKDFKNAEELGLKVEIQIIDNMKTVKSQDENILKFQNCLSKK